MTARWVREIVEAVNESGLAFVWPNRQPWWKRATEPEIVGITYDHRGRVVSILAPKPGTRPTLSQVGFAVMIGDLGGVTLSAFSALEAVERLQLELQAGDRRSS